MTTELVPTTAMEHPFAGLLPAGIPETTDTGMTLYLVAEEGGAMAEDGDAWDYYSLWVTPARAEAAYAKIEL